MAERRHTASGLVVHQSTGRHKFKQIRRTHTKAVTTGPSTNGHLGLSFVNEVGRLVISGTPTGGTFTVTIDGNTTAGVAFNASAKTLQDAIVALGAFTVDDVEVTGGPGPGDFFDIFLKGAFEVKNVAMLANGSALTGGITPAATITTSQDGAGTIIRDLAGGLDDQLPTDLIEDEIPAVHNPPTDWVNRLEKESGDTVTIPTAPTGSEEGTRTLWRGNTFAGRIPVPPD